MRDGDTAPAGLTPQPGNPRFPLFDGLRAAAALSVLAVHSFVATDYFVGWEGAYARQLASGVAIFFLISGFLLYRPFVAARAAGKPAPSLKIYARRRLLRILPAYWFALTVLALWPGLPGHVLSGDAWRYYFFLQDFDGNTLFNGLGTAWSLGTEMSFYLLLPLYAIVLARPRFARDASAIVRAELVALSAVTVGAFVFRALVTDKHPELGFTVFGTADWFALGMGLAVVSVLAQQGTMSAAVDFVRRHANLCWLAAFAMLSLAAAYWQRTGNYDAYGRGPLHFIWGGLAFFLLLPAAFQGRGAPRRVLGASTVAWLGLVSYGIYLWHLPLAAKVHASLDRAGLPVQGAVGTAALILALSAATVACAAFSYYVVELPFLKRKARASLAATEAVPAVGAAKAS